MVKNFKLFLESIEQNSIANDIFKYLGGNKFVAMTGASIVKTANGISVKFKGSKIANIMGIELNGTDTYTVTFGKVTSLKYKEISKFEDLLGFQLAKKFETVTGLNTSL